MIQDTPTALRLTRVVHTDPQTAFDAWTQPEQMRRWACPEGASIEAIDVDFTVGGRYTLRMKTEEGGTHTAVGEYRAIEPPHRVVYTWDWVEDEFKMDVDTLVTVEFRPHENGTEVVLSHEAFPAAEATELHLEGWSSCLDKLERLFAGADVPAAATGA